MRTLADVFGGNIFYMRRLSNADDRHDHYKLFGLRIYRFTVFFNK